MWDDRTILCDSCHHAARWHEITANPEAPNRYACAGHSDDCMIRLP